MKLTVPRKTLRSAAGPVTGIGVRCGFDVQVRLLPAGGGEGLALHRTDLDLRLPLHLSHALALPNCTAIGTSPGDATLFVEHLMAALHVHGITDLVVEVSGPEVPLLDGSARDWDALVRQAGVVECGGEVEALVVASELCVEDGERRVCATPSERPVFEFDLKYDHPLIGHEIAGFELGIDDFAQDLAPARTFALEAEVQAGLASGQLKGGSDENCRIVYADHYSAPPTLPQEFARHKINDMLGDFYLLGRPVIGHISGFRTGHAHNRELLRCIAEAANI